LVTCHQRTEKVNAGAHYKPSFIQWYHNCFCTLIPSRQNRALKFCHSQTHHSQACQTNKPTDKKRREIQAPPNLACW